MLNAPSLTATSTEALERYSTCYLVGGNVRQADNTEAPTHYAPRYFPANAAATIVSFEHGNRYRCVLSGSCSANQDLLQDNNGLLSPGASGPKVGRAAYGGVAGDIIEFIYEPASAAGGGGLDAGQVNQLIDTAVTRSWILSADADDVAPTDADWPEGAPGENDSLLIVRTPSDTRKRFEYWVRSATVDVWNKVETETPGSTSSPRRSEFVVLVDIPADTPINTNAATATYTSLQGLDYSAHDPGTNATYLSIYNVSFFAYVNTGKLPQSDIVVNDLDPAGWVRFNVPVPAGSEIAFESQVLS